MVGGPWNEFVESEDSVAVVVIHPQNLASQMLLRQRGGGQILQEWGGSGIHGAMQSGKATAAQFFEV